MNWYRGHRHTVEPSAALYLITAPADDVVSLEDMKKHLRVDGDATDDDELIEVIRDAVGQHLDGRDGYLGRALIDQTWELRMSWFPGGCDVIRIPLPPLIEIVSVKYIDANGDEQTFADDNYHIAGVGDRGTLRLRNGKCWPTLGAGWPEPVIIQFRAGYLDGSMSPAAPDVPAPIVAAIKLFAANLYENRQTIVIGQTAIELPWAAEALLRAYRVF